SGRSSVAPSASGHKTKASAQGLWPAALSEQNNPKPYLRAIRTCPLFVTFLALSAPASALLGRSIWRLIQGAPLLVDDSKGWNPGLDSVALSGHKTKPQPKDCGLQPFPEQHHPTPY